MNTPAFSTFLFSKHAVMWCRIYTVCESVLSVCSSALSELCLRNHAANKQKNREQDKFPSVTLPTQKDFNHSVFILKWCFNIMTESLKCEVTPSFPKSG